MSESVRKAISIDQRDADARTSSMLDDVFFILRKCVRRSLSSSSVDCICAMLNNGAAMLDADILNKLKTDVKVRHSEW